MGPKKRRTKQPKLFTVGDTIPIGPGIEFRHDEDDAWYNVQIVLIADTLIVKFVEFPDDEDVQFHVADFIDYDEIFKFLRRFRPLCLQLEGSDCSEVKLGIRVCALLDLGDNGRRYFDAIVEGVKRKEHTIMDGIENCSCSVVLSWMHGPKAGTLTLARVEDLCLIRSQKQLDPRLACFSELVKWKHGITLPKLITEDINQISEGEKPMGEALSHDGDILGYESSEDIDLGGGDRAPAKRRQNRDYNIGSMDKEACSFFVVDNLEKDVTPSTISDFIREQTGVEIDAFVFLSFPSQTYTRGALVVDSDEHLEILCNFVAKSDQMITSSKGRPWVVLDSSANEWVRPSFWCLEPEHQSADDGLKVVKLGSEEYRKAEKLRELFLNFTDHQEKLFERLVMEEQRILDG
ncbi:uncharacterized protein LOC130806042 isoform X2 [Amaranthus tricolor]|uniref:uncharacterized protein LOC130806042 isoform X2 n=1 Tax=Amaranthus tricolor TaxID=29722 RepID=UPI00258417BB|nr:uncharacterized protein LOC130806042 isoform X2 [Amaranthus tricolor]